MEIIFFNKKTEDFFELTQKIIAPKTRRIFEALEKYGHNLGMPYSRALGKGLFELRIVGMINTRFIYTFHENKICMLNGFIKKTNKIPDKEINYAHKQLKLLLQ
jgi:phage-related protein